jgi:ATP-dependent helicase HepA
MLEKADAKAELQAETILSTVVADMQKSQSDEMSRLVALKKKNPNIREAEIDFIKTQTQLLEKYLSETQLQLEAVRVIVAV